MRRQRQRLHTPVLQALAWRLHDPAALSMAPAAAPPPCDKDWVLEQLSRGPHGLPHQLAIDAWQQAFEAAPQPLDGLALIAKHTLTLEHGLPRVDNEEGWDAVVRLVDPDLIALASMLHRAPLRRDQTLHHRLGWPPVLRAHRTVFHGVCDGKLAEVHAHIGGSLPNSLLWTLLISGMLPPEALETQETGPTNDTWSRLFLEARATLAKLTRCCERSSAAPADDWPGTRSRLLNGVCFDSNSSIDAWPLGNLSVNGSAALALLLPERQTLHQAWQRLAGGGGAAPNLDLGRELLRLVQLRCAFNARLSQAPGHRGLAQFIRYIDRRSGLWAAPARGSTARRRNAQRVNALGFQLLAEIWLDDRLQDRRGADPPFDIEWRTTIPLRGREAVAFFVGLARGLRPLLQRRQAPDLRVGIVHHTIKTAARRDGEVAMDEFRRIWHLLCDQPDIRPFLVGVDAAASELSCPPRSFSAAYAWLRRQMDHEAPNDDGLPIDLGFTFHAGEDFRDLMTGLRHVDEAAHLLSMRPGDRIGHALALSWPVDDFYVTRTQSFPTIGEHALDLCWAAAMLSRSDDDRDGSLRRQARDRLIELLTEVGANPDDPVDTVISALDVDAPHSWASPHARLLRHQNEEGPGNRDGIERALREDELLTRLGIALEHHEGMAPRPPRPREWRRLVAACQRIARSRMREQGLVIEINPSSNRLVGGFVSIDRLPYTQINRPGPRGPDQAANLPIAIGTDDAGVFHTSLRREYEMVGQSALEQGYSLPDVVAWLDEVRRTGRRASFLRRHPLSADVLQEYLRRLSAEES